MSNGKTNYWRLLVRGDLGFPYTTFCIILSCLIISLPILSSMKYYNKLALWSENPRPWQYITYQFCHGEPGGVNFWPHLITNIAFFLLFGVALERLVGSGRFFVLSLAGFATNLIRKFIVTTTVSSGASGICWGYLVFIIPILVWIYRRRRSNAFRDMSFVLAVILTAFGLFGLAIIMWFMDHSVVNNTNIAHATSILTATPFMLAWRRDMFDELERIELEEDNRSKAQSVWDKIAVVPSVLILIFNSIMVLGVATGYVS